jgi:hypothetical protein
MNVLAIYSVNQHIAELAAEAHAARLARQAHPAHEGHSRIREFVASLVTSARVALTPPLPTLDRYPNRN